MAKFFSGDLYDYTEIFREHAIPLRIAKDFDEDNLDKLKKTLFIFNNGHLHYKDDLYLMSARVIIPADSAHMISAEIPAMWRPIKRGRFSYGGNWNNAYDYAVVFLIRLRKCYFHKPHVLAVNYIEMMQPGTLPGREDPRIYRKASGEIFVYTIGMTSPCDVTKHPDKVKQCAYISEWPLYVEELVEVVGEVEEKFILNVGDLDTRIIPCRNVLENLDDDGVWYMKNWSPWSRDGRDFYSDFYPQYTIYEQNAADGNCSKIKNNPLPLSSLNKLKEYFTFQFNFGDSKKLFSFTSTTPSIRINDSLRDAYFPNTKNVYAGVAHIRSSTGTIVRDDEMYNAIILAMDREKEMYKSFSDLLKIIKQYFDDDKIYLHSDFYMMCVYFFNPDTEDGHKGTFLGISDVFLPMGYQHINVKGSDSRFALSFPVGFSMLDNDDFMISYGEGDVKARLMVTRFEEIGYHNMDDNLPLSIKFKILRLESQNFKQTKSIERLIEEQYNWSEDSEIFMEEQYDWSENLEIDMEE